MSGLYSISHADPVVEDKVNYFANYYNYVVFQMGRNADYEIENFSSLIEKIIFQLEFNTSDKVKPFLMSYLSHPLIREDNVYFKNQFHYDLILKRFNQLKLILNRKKFSKEIEENKDEILVDLRRFKTYLKRYLFKQSLNEIISYLRCKHKLLSHQVELKYHTSVIAVELFYSRSGKEDLSSIFNRILSNNINEFPFCPNFETNNKDDLVNAKNEFIEKRTFEEQFFGILNFKNKRLKKYSYIFRIGNVKCQDKLKIPIKNVSFYSPTHKQILKLKAIHDANDSFGNFFSKEYGMFVIVVHETRHEKSHQKDALKMAQVWLDEINDNVKSNAYLDRNSYLRTDNFLTLSGSVRLGDKPKEISVDSVNRITSFDTVSYIESNKIKSKGYFLSHEEVYLEAKMKGDVGLYWRYLENLIGKPCKSKFVDIVIDEFKDYERMQVESYIVDCFSMWNYSENVTGFTTEQARKMYSDMNTESFDFNSLKGKTINPFIEELVFYLDSIENRNVESYLFRVLNEVYEFRNFSLHDGNINSKSKLKLLSTIPVLFILLS